MADHMETLKAMCRPKRYFELVNIPQDVIDYAAGMVDADGSIGARVSICQSLKGIDALYFLHDNFGGQVELHQSGNDMHQPSFNWAIDVKQCEPFCSLILDRLLLKRREVECLLIYLRSKSTIEREDALKMIKEYHNTPHDDIPEHVKPSLAYFGGFFDGEGCMDANGKNYQKHSINQIHRPICDVFNRRWKANVMWTGKIYRWEIHTYADEFLKEIAPYIVGKKKQVDLILNMKPGEGQLVHAKLRELKGNYTAPTPRIDAINRGEGRVYKTPPKELPKGVHYHERTKKYAAIIGFQGKDYHLKSCNTPEEAKEIYDKYKKQVIEFQRGGGPMPDLTFNTVEAKKAPIPKAGTKLPKGVYLTASNTFQTRYRHGGKTHQLGTFRTVEEAIQRIQAFEQDLIDKGEIILQPFMEGAVREL